MQHAARERATHPASCEKPMLDMSRWYYTLPAAATSTCEPYMCCNVPRWGARGLGAAAARRTCASGGCSSSRGTRASTALSDRTMFIAQSVQHETRPVRVQYAKGVDGGPQLCKCKTCKLGEGAPGGVRGRRNLKIDKTQRAMAEKWWLPAGCQGPMQGHVATHGFPPPSFSLLTIEGASTIRGLQPSA